jgi:S1-C subfamily serine protease
MSDEKQVDPGEPALSPPDQALTPPPAFAGPVPPPMWTQPPAPPRDTIWHRIAAFIVLIAVVAAAAGAGIGWSLARAINTNQVAQNTAQPESPIQPATPGTGSSTGTSAIAAKVDPAIVDINTTVGSSQAAGTGMLISSTGEILTNNHVVAQSTSITVTVQGRSQTYKAHLVGVDVSQDIAVIQIDSSVSGLPTVTFASSSSVKVGDSVIAIGNALGQGGTPPAHSGQVTSLDQTITASEGGGQSETLNGMIESDAVIYEGDSGGALLNSSGQVVGMITAGQAQGFRSAASNLGYAIPSNTLLSTLNRIRAHEQAPDLQYSQVGYMGVQVQTLDSSTAAQLGLSISTGALVVATPASGSPASDAGITRYSVITNLGGTTIDSADTLGPAIKAHQPGDQVSVTWVNTSGTHHATVTLGGVNP